MSNVELKPCPFCGSEAKVFERMFGGYDYPPTGFWVIECGCCEAMMECFDTKEAAVCAWNKRMNDSLTATTEATWKQEGTYCKKCDKITSVNLGCWLGIPIKYCSSCGSVLEEIAFISKD